MKKIGTYKIEASFYIPDRGIITVCQQIDGIVKLGSSTNIEFQGAIIPAKIVGSYMPSLGDDEIWRCGILLRFEDGNLIKRIASEKLREQTIEIFVDDVAETKKD